ncbi:MAG: uroporphyrinogen-III synthase [Gammaproteobacteria bacterium]|nr:uroporphyrinogen-III synthase [Gammaproteobacteria bacterium]
MSSELSGIDVLVTRPVHQAEAFCLLVELAGGQAIRFPVIEIKPIALDAAAEYGLQKSADYLIFISANAVRLGVDEMRRVAPERLEQSRVIAIGKATAHGLQSVGIVPDLVPPSPYNSESLLGLPEMQKISGQRFTIIKGKGGRTYLMEQLRARGGIVHEVDIYVRIKPQQSNAALSKLTESQRAVVSVTSVKGLHYLFEMASVEQAEWLKQHAYFLVPGERVAEATRDLHIRHAPIIAENATDQVMFAALLKLI